MIKKYHMASSILFSLMTLFSIGTVLFLNFDHLLGKNNVIQHNYQHYLSEKMALFDVEKRDKTQECQRQQQETVNIKLKQLNYVFHCQFHSIFIQPKPTKEKYILVENINDWLDLTKYQHNIYTISSLDELPPSSEISPKIVRTTQAITGRLTQPFYGIVITDHLFVFTDKRIYGTIYSSYAENEPNRRNHSYRKNVIHYIEQDNSAWHYLPNSTHLAPNDNP